MDDIKDIIPLLNYLLPGFLSALIFYRLTSFSIPSPFERIIQALVFTSLVQFSVNIIKYILFMVGKLYSFGQWDESFSYILSIFLAVLIGLLVAYFTNNDKIHAYLRRKNITRMTSYPSEWFNAFLDPKYIIIHFNDERRLRGWPIEWPSEYDKGHFILIEAFWIDDNNQYVKLEGVDKIMVNVQDVKMIEFLES